MYSNLKWIMIFSMCMPRALLNSKQSNSSKIASRLRWIHLLMLLLACVFFTWHHSLMKLICESMVYLHEEEDVLIDCVHWPFKRITLFLIRNPYTTLFPCYNSLLFLYFIFLMLEVLFIFEYSYCRLFDAFSGTLLAETWFTKQIVAQTIDEWCTLGVKLSRKLIFNEFELSLSKKSTCSHGVNKN
jgi:hypothetical protein